MAINNFAPAEYGGYVAGVESGGGGGGGEYDAYDYVIKRVDNGTPTVEKGTWSEVYDALQAMEPVTGLYIHNTTPTPYHDTQCLYVPLTYTQYYSSADMFYCDSAYAIYGSTPPEHLHIDWLSNGTIVVDS